MEPQVYDRTLGDVGNVVFLEHVNVTVPDTATAMAFYVHGLGLTRDPYIDLGPDLMWINIGRQQFHLPTGPPKVVRGVINLVMPDLDALLSRLDSMHDVLVNTVFAFDVQDAAVNVRGPWGNRFRVREASADARMQLGLESVDFVVPVATAKRIADFYREAFGAPVDEGAGRSVVRIGTEQRMTFTEGSQLESFDGHHVAVYVSDFSGPHRWLDERGLIIEESDAYQYRFERIIDPTSNEVVFEVEHEVRSLHHPLRSRRLINRNPNQMLMGYVPGRDDFMPDFS